MTTERTYPEADRPTYISVIIPTYKRPESLGRALDSLFDQTFQDFEILVVDNIGDPATKQSVEERSARLGPSLHYLIEPELGLHNARHRGVRQARGDLLVFTDDDATFAADWIAAYSSAFAAHPEMAAAGGPVDAVWEAPPPKWLRQLMISASSAGTFPPLSILQGGEVLTLDDKGTFFGVNMAIRRDVVFAVGGFNPENFGDRWLGDGETGLNRKLWERGMLIAHVPQARANHHIPRSRMSRSYLRRRMANEGACIEYTYFHAADVRAGTVLRRLASIGFGITRSLGILPARYMIRKDKSAVLRCSLELAALASRAQYVVRLIYDRQLRELVLADNWLARD